MIENGKERVDSLRLFVEGLYYPKGNEDKKDLILDLLNQYSPSSPEEGDEGKEVLVLTISTAGNAPRESFKGYSLSLYSVVSICQTYITICQPYGKGDIRNFIFKRITRNSKHEIILGESINA